MYTIKAECINCHISFTEKTEHKIEVEIAQACGIACKACRGIAADYYVSADYQVFEESETDYRF